MKNKKFLTAVAIAVISFSSNIADAAEVVKIDLSSSIKRALQYNRDIEQSQKDRESAKWAHSQARRATGPKIIWSSSANKIGGDDYELYRESHELYGTPAYKNEFSNTVGLEMPIYTGGRAEAQIDSARYKMNYADLTLENTRQEIKYQTTAAYYQILQRRALVRVEENAVNLLQEHLNNVNIQYQVGTVAKSDVLGSKVQLASRQQSLITANSEYLNAMADLNNLIGLETDTVLEADDELSYQKYDSSLSECIAYALENRPDGVAANYAIKQAEMNIKDARAGLFPSITAIVQKNFAGESAFEDNHSESWDAGLQMSWEVFDNGVTSVQVHEAKTELEKVKSQALQVQEKIKLEVNKAYNDLLAAEKNISITSEAIKMAEEDFMISKMRYLEGIDTNLVVMDAQEKLTEAQTNYYNALYRYNVARAALDKAVGVPVNINVPIYVATEKATESSNKALEKAAINQDELNLSR